MFEMGQVARRAGISQTRAGDQPATARGVCRAARTGPLRSPSMNSGSAAQAGSACHEVCPGGSQRSRNSLSRPVWASRLRRSSPPRGRAETAHNHGRSFLLRPSAASPLVRSTVAMRSLPMSRVGSCAGVPTAQRYRVWRGSSLGLGVGLRTDSGPYQPHNPLLAPPDSVRLATAVKSLR